MPITLTQAASRMTATAAATATALASGTTTAEVQALAKFLEVLALRRDLSAPALTLVPIANGAEISNN